MKPMQLALKPSRRLAYILALVLSFINPQQRQRDCAHPKEWKMLCCKRTANKSRD
jgi:hypothetical protein